MLSNGDLSAIATYSLKKAIIQGTGWNHLIAFKLLYIIKNGGNENSGKLLKILWRDVILFKITSLDDIFKWHLWLFPLSRKRSTFGKLFFKV